MSRKVIVGIVLLLIIGAVIFRFRNNLGSSTTPTASNSITTTPPTSTIVTPPAPDLPWPITGGKERVTKKLFGTYVTPQSSPVTPEKFTGYHTGWDFETTDAELNTDVLIVAACDGQIVYRNYVNGYGGVAIQSCNFGGLPITVLYGHLRLSSSTAKDTNLKSGDKIGLLGNAYSTETDGERKHLHFSIHHGNAIELKGYVQNKADLSSWIDPADFSLLMLALQMRQDGCTLREVCLLMAKKGLLSKRGKPI